MNWSTTQQVHCAKYKQHLTMHLIKNRTHEVYFLIYVVVIVNENKVK